MTLIKTKSSAGKKLPSVRTRLSDLFNTESFFNEPFFEAPTWNEWRMQVPAANVKETKEAYQIEVAAPGLEKEDFEIIEENGLLEIKVEREEKNTEEKDNYTRKEYSYTNFCRSFTLPETVDGEQISAKYYDGVLRLSVPKVAESQQPKKEIAVG